MTQAYHASTTRFDAPRGLFCVAYAADEATPYLFGQAGYLYTVTVPDDLEIATRGYARQMARSIDIDPDDYEQVWDLLESEPELVRALITDGVQAVEYTDLAPDNAFEHQTLMLLDSILATNVAVSEIEEADDVA